MNQREINNIRLSTILWFILVVDFVIANALSVMYLKNLRVDVKPNVVIASPIVEK